MAGISVPGMGSGLDVTGIVNQLMSLERKPQQAVQQRQKEFEAQLSAYGQVKSALSKLQSAMKDLGSIDKFQVFNASSSDESVFTTEATSAAAKGTYSIEVVSLAAAHKMRTAGVSDAQNSFGSGSLQVGVGSDSFTVNVDGTNNTLEGIRDAINSASDNPGVTASIIDDGTNRYLSLTSEETGTANAITVTASDDGSGASSLTLFENANMTQVQAAQDAVVNIDGAPPTGIQVTSSSNTVTGAIEGVTLTLEKTGTATLTVDRDLDAVKESVQAFVDAYNELRGKVSSLRDKELKGDNTLLTLDSQLRNVLNTPASGLSTSLSYLSQVGIKTERDGTLSLDTGELSDALDSDYTGVAQLFANEGQGFAYRMEAVADKMLDFDGLIDAKEDSLNSTIDGLKDQSSRWDYRLELIQKRYMSQFTALDGTLSQMQSTSAYLTQQLAGLSG